MRDLEGDLHRVLRASVVRTPLPLYLRVEDRNSMAHSVEGRLPFLDHQLVELAFRLGPEWFLRGPWNKYLLRQAMEGLIPESVRTRKDKMGFPTPMAAWFKGPLHEQVREIVHSREFKERGIYNLPAIERDLERHRRGEINVDTQIWDIVQWDKIARMAKADPGLIPSAPSVRA
jgi:asparagine synthase (glutamine-hydrolysing)